MNAPTTAIFFKIATLIFYLDLFIKDKILPQKIHMWNMKALSFTIQKLWPVFFSFIEEIMRSWYLTLTLDDLDFGTGEKVLPQVKGISHTIQKL